MQVTAAQLEASCCRSSLSYFVKTFWHAVAPGEELVWNWHLDVLADTTQEAYERVFRNEPKEYDLVTNVPPGSSKSTIKSVMAPAWAWTRLPHFAFLGASHTIDLALDLARKTRDVVNSELYQLLFPGITLREDQNTKRAFMTQRGGLRAAVGAGGSIIGRHFHVIGVDDPLDPKGATSDAEIYEINEWMTKTLFQRKKDQSISFVDLVMQRLHQDDPSKHLLKGGGVRHICLPASLEGKVHPVELEAKYVNGLLDPVRLPLKVLMEKRKPNNLSEWGYAGQYLQDPVPPGGGFFKVQLLRTGIPPARFKQVVRFWDKASTASTKACFTAGVKMAEDFQGGYWVLDVRRGQWDTGERERVIRQTAEADGGHVVVGIEEEPGSGGKDSSLMTVRTLKGFRVKIFKARGKKEVRAEAFSTQVNAGNVWLPSRMKEGQSWIGWAEDYVEELRHWPISTFLDQGDASGGGFGMLAKKTVPIGTLRKRRAS